MRDLFSTKLLKIIFTVALLIILIPLLGVKQTSSELARSANSFVDSIGVAVHLTYLDTSYGQYQEVIKPRLQELGIRHIRGDGFSVEDKLSQEKFNDLAKIGIKSTLIMDPRWIGGGAEVVELSKLVINAIEGVEGPNEWDVQPDAEYQGENFPAAIRNYQAEIYAAIKADADTAHLAVLSPSIAHPQNATQLGQVDCNFANMHSYSFSPWGMPTEGLEDQWIPAANAVCSNKPIIATETGYHNAINQPEQPGISEQAASKYLLRLFLEDFNRGIERTYSYELLDLQANPQRDYSQYNYGLLYYDGLPKPDFIALRNIIKLLDDEVKASRGAVFGGLLRSSSAPSAYHRRGTVHSNKKIEQAKTIDSLDYQIKGQKTEIHHTLLQKQNRNFYLILWQEVPSFDLAKRTNIEVSPLPLKIILNTDIETANVYQPINSTKILRKYNNPKKFVVEVGDDPIIIELINHKKR